MSSERRGWDSNPRSAYTDSGFQDQRDRPLCHPSAPGNDSPERYVPRCQTAVTSLKPRLGNSRPAPRPNAWSSALKAIVKAGEDFEQLVASGAGDEVPDHPEPQRRLLPVPVQDLAAAFELRAQRRRRDVTSCGLTQPSSIPPARQRASTRGLVTASCSGRRAARANGPAGTFERGAPVRQVVQDAQDEDDVGAALAERPGDRVALHRRGVRTEHPAPGLQRGQRDVRGDVARTLRPEPGDGAADARAHLDHDRVVADPAPDAAEVVTPITSMRIESHTKSRRWCLSGTRDGS